MFAVRAVEHLSVFCALCTCEDRGLTLQGCLVYGELGVDKLELLQLRLKLLQVIQRRLLRVARLFHVAPELGDSALEFREASCDNFCGERLLQDLQVPVHTVEGAQSWAQSETKSLAKSVMQR